MFAADAAAAICDGVHIKLGRIETVVGAAAARTAFVVQQFGRAHEQVMLVDQVGVQMMMRRRVAGGVDTKVMIVGGRWWRWTALRMMMVQQEVVVVGIIEI